MKTSIIVLSWNGREFLPACLDAAIAQEPPPDEVLVVDNGSTDGSAGLVAKRWPQARLIENGANLGFAGGMNVGIRAAGGDVLILLNQDTVAAPGWLEAIRRGFATRPQLGIAGCKTLFPDGRVQHAGARLLYPLALSEHVGSGESEDDAAYPEREVDFVTGAAMAIRSEALAKVGLLDEGFYPAYFEDTDLCHRVRAAGYEVRYLPTARLVHYESSSVPRGSFNSFLYFNRSRLRFVLKHYRIDQIRQDFLPAERQHLLTETAETERLALQRAYLEAAVDWGLPELLDKGADGDARAAAQLASTRPIVDELLALRLAVEPGERPIPAGPLMPMPTESRVPFGYEALRSNRDLERLAGDLAQRLEQVEQAVMLYEFTFASRVPVFGRLLASVRSAWAAVAARWLVRSLTEQQQLFNQHQQALNQHLLRLLSLLARSDQMIASADWGVAMTARRAQVVELELRQTIQTLDRRLTEIERRLDATVSDEAHVDR